MKQIVCIINDVPMTRSEFIAWKKSKNVNKPTKRVSKTKTLSTTDVYHSHTNQIMKDLKVLNSILNYANNGYRYWGTIARTILGLKQIDRPYNKTYLDIKKLQRIYSQIQECNNKRCINELLYRFMWTLEDVEKDLNALINGIQESCVCYGLANSECINGTGKKLGLHTIVIKASVAVEHIKGHNDETLRLMEIL